MSITLELNPDLEARLRAEAVRRGEPVTQYLSQLVEGAWQQADLSSGTELCSTPPNEGMLTALREIQRIQADMPPTFGGDTEALIQEARSGGMYDIDSTK